MCRRKVRVRHPKAIASTPTPCVHGTCLQPATRVLHPQQHLDSHKGDCLADCLPHKLEQFTKLRALTVELRPDKNAVDLSLCSSLHSLDLTIYKVTRMWVRHCAILLELSCACAVQHGRFGQEHHTSLASCSLVFAPLACPAAILVPPVSCRPITAALL